MSRLSSHSSIDKTSLKEDWGGRHWNLLPLNTHATLHPDNRWVSHLNGYQSLVWVHIFSHFNFFSLQICTIRPYCMSFFPVPERILSHCYQILLVMVSLHYITIFVRVFAPSPLRPVSCWGVLQLRQTFLCMAAQFLSVEAHQTVYMWVTVMQFMLYLCHLHIIWSKQRKASGLGLVRKTKMSRNAKCVKDR